MADNASTETSENAAGGPGQTTALSACLVLLAAAPVLYFSLPNHLNADLRDALLPWLHHLIEAGRFAALGDAVYDYTPTYIYLLSIASHLDGTVADITIIKSISILFNFVAAFLVYNITAQFHRPPTIPAMAAAGFLFLPTAVVNSAYWGQVDILHTSLLLASFYFTLIRRPFPAVFCFSVAISVKLQSIFFGPYLLFLVFRREIPWRYLILIPIVYSVAMLPAAIAGRPWAELLTIYLAQSERFHDLSRAAPNLYTFLQEHLHYYYRRIVALGIGITAIIGLIISLSALRLREVSASTRLLLATFTVALMPFMLPKMHDRYFFTADVFAYVLVFAMPRMWPVAVTLQVSSLLAYSDFLFGVSVGPHIGGVLNTALLLGLTIYILRHYGHELAPRPRRAA